MVSTGGLSAGRLRLGGPVFASGDLVAQRYRVVRFLAQGGMGEVYEAEDVELRQEVALKTVSAHIGGDPAAIDRFKREIALARRVTHPNVCRIFDLGQHLLPPLPDGSVSCRRSPSSPWSCCAARPCRSCCAAAAAWASTRPFR